jgi:hypothetical protein
VALSFRKVGTNLADKRWSLGRYSLLADSGHWVYFYVGIDWIDVAQDRDKWRALVNMVMNFRVVLEWLQNWWPLE